MDEHELQSIESLCVNCEKNGITRLLLTKIPYFQDIIVSSFECPHCGYKNNEVQTIGGLKSHGERLTLRVEKEDDLDRQVIKSEHATIRIPSIDFEIPPQTQRGVTSTVQGIIQQAASNLAKDQPVRCALQPEVGAAVAKIIKQLEAFAAGGDSLPFLIELDDPSGNSFIENREAPKKDPCLTSTKYERTREQLHQMGYYEEQSSATQDKPGADLPAELKPKNTPSTLPQESEGAENDGSSDNAQVSFVFECAHCGQPGSQNMCQVDIPGFRKCIIMAFVCEHCGARSNEVKAAGAYGEKARKWTLHVESKEDLNRDVLKSDCAGLSIPELDLSLEAGTLGGVFTTVEGLLMKIADQLAEQNPFVGDSALPAQRDIMISLVTKVRELASGANLPFTLIIDDAADHSHIGRRGGELFELIAKAARSAVVPNADASMESALHLEDDDKRVDPQLVSVTYTRTKEQDEDLGLADMKVEGYE